MHTGKVTLIGAGPGDPELLTLKAARTLAEADVVLVDDLVNREILHHAPRARIIEVGKRGGCQSTPQHFINRLMTALASQGQRVVRLKGGDPFLFGRGGEEMLALRAAGITVDVIPGITSGIAVPASIGIPVTHREYTHGVTFVTGHTRDGDAPDWRALVAGGTTLVIYMGLKHLPEIVSNLLESGLSSSTPAALIQQGTLPQQKQVITDVANLPYAARQHDFQSPSLIVVGEVASLAQVASSSHSGNTEQVSERDEVRGARRAEAETYQVDRRGFEHRATRQFARVATCSGFPSQQIAA